MRQFRVYSLKFKVDVLKIIFLLGFMLIAAPASAVMEIVVEAGKEDAVYDYIYGSGEIDLEKPKSLSEIVSDAAGLNIISKSFPVLQGDVFINGGSFEQAAILVDGVKVNSLQTGHYNMDMAFTAFDIEEVSVLKNANSIAGSGGFSGLVNIRTKRHKEDALKTAAEYGTYDTFYSVFSGTKMFEEFAATFSAEKSSSRGYHYDTEFDTNTFYLKLENYSFGYNSVSAGYNEKDFGAFDYYSPGLNKPSHEYVNTKYLKIESEPFDFLKAEAHMKSHFDHFIYDIDAMTGQNRHTEGLYGGSVKYIYNIDKENSVSAKYAFDRDEIISTNLGTRGRNLNSGLINSFFKIDFCKINANLGIEKYDVYNNIDILPSVNASADLGKELKISAAWSYAVRYPNYTELYYTSPSTLGNSALLPEKCQSYSFNMEYNPDNLAINAGVFYRNNSGLIDWGKDLSSDPFWVSQNIGAVNTAGLNAGLKVIIAFAKLNVDYSYLDYYISRQYISKYGAMYLRNTLKASLLFDVLEFKIKVNYVFRNYINRVQAQNAFDMMVSRKILDWLELTVKVDNIFDYYYEEIQGIPAPRRMIIARVDVEL